MHSTSGAHTREPWDLPWIYSQCGQACLEKLSAAQDQPVQSKRELWVDSTTVAETNLQFSWLCSAWLFKGVSKSVQVPLNGNYISNFGAF